MSHRSGLLSVIVGLGVALAACGGDQTAREREVPPDARPGGVLIVNFAPDSADTFAAVSHDSILVLDWLRIYADSTGTPLATQDHAFGKLVMRIGPRENGGSGYWLYEVNGEMAMKSASELRVSYRDTVTFTFK